MGRVAQGQVLGKVKLLFSSTFIKHRLRQTKITNLRQNVCSLSIWNPVEDRDGIDKRQDSEVFFIGHHMSGQTKTSVTGRSH